jgi:hypothetical protein
MVPRPVDWAEVGSALLSDAKSGVIQVGRPLPRPLADAAASSALRPSNVLRPRRRGRRTSPTALAWDRYARALCGAGSSIANHPNIAPQRNRRGPDTTLALAGVLAWCRFSRKSSSSSREVEIRLVPARWWAPSRAPCRSDTRADRGPELSPSGPRLRQARAAHCCRSLWSSSPGGDDGRRRSSSSGATNRTHTRRGVVVEPSRRWRPDGGPRRGFWIGPLVGATAHPREEWSVAAGRVVGADG